MSSWLYMTEYVALLFPLNIKKDFFHLNKRKGEGFFAFPLSEIIGIMLNELSYLV